MDVPGFLNVSLLALWESNAPFNSFSRVSTPRYHYDVHPMLNLAWGIPFNIGIPLSFEGFANFIASKGKNEFGGDTAAETNIDMQVMYDLSPLVGAAKNTFRLGLEYQYWNNKFGNNHKGVAGPGASVKTPMIRAEYHFQANPAGVNEHAPADPRMRPHMPPVPELSGLDVSRTLAAIRPDLPVLIISGYIFDELPAQARRAGMREVIRKQHVLEELVPAIARALRAG